MIRRLLPVLALAFFLAPLGARRLQSQGNNLLVNPGFETADPSGSGYSGVTIPGWTETGTPTVIASAS